MVWKRHEGLEGELWGNAPSVMHDLEQGLENFFCKGPDSEYLRLCGTCGCNYSALPLDCKSSHGEANGCGCVPVKLNLQKQVAGEIWPLGLGSQIPDLELDFVVKPISTASLHDIGKLCYFLRLFPDVWHGGNNRSLGLLYIVSAREMWAFFLKYFYLFIYYWLRWVFVAARRLSLVAASGGYSSLWCTGFSLWWLLLLRSMGSRPAGFSGCSTWAQ